MNTSAGYVHFIKKSGHIAFHRYYMDIISQRVHFLNENGQISGLYKRVSDQGMKIANGSNPKFSFSVA